jgi:hypothetical protein
MTQKHRSLPVLSLVIDLAQVAREVFYRVVYGAHNGDLYALDDAPVRKSLCVYFREHYAGFRTRSTELAQ